MGTASDAFRKAGTEGITVLRPRVLSPFKPLPQTIHPTQQPLVNKWGTTHPALSVRSTRKWRPVVLTLFEREAREAHQKLSCLHKASEKQGREFRILTSVLPLPLWPFTLLDI